MASNLRGYTKRNLNRGIIDNFLYSLNVTNWIILVNILCYLIGLFFILAYPDKINLIALQPSSILQGNNLWTLLTSMFLHFSFIHLFFNMFSLFFIGSFVERIIGSKRIFWYYLISGLFAGLIFVLLAGYFGSTSLGSTLFGNPDIIGVGASGAIFGLLGILAILVPRSKVSLIVGPLIAIILLAASEQFIGNQVLLGILNLFFNIYLFIAIFSMFSFNSRMVKLTLPVEVSFWALPIVAIIPLVVIGLFVDLPIGNTAHFGGFLAGVFFGLYLRKKYSKKVKMLNEMVR